MNNLESLIMSDNSISNLPAELVTMMAEYVNEHKSSPFNNRRNKLRNLVDYIYVQSMDRHDMQGINDYLEEWLTNYRNRITLLLQMQRRKQSSLRSTVGDHNLASKVWRASCIT